MDTAPLKAYAPAARTAFIRAVTDAAARFGLSHDKVDPIEITGDTAIINGVAHPLRVAQQRATLEERIDDQGFDQVMDSIAYTWFNRLAAIRYMEIHGYLDHGYRVLSHPAGNDRQPEILEHAAEVDLPGIDRDQVVELKLDGTKDEELYRLLLLGQCNALHEAMPFLFATVDAADELLLHTNLLNTDSPVRQMVESIDEDLWEDIEIIGWLYQFYISEKKDEVIGKVVKSEDIPAATQLFTPNWIVKYMVQNSLGAQWLATYPQSPLKGQMEYYIEPAEQTDEVNAQLAAITPSQLNPEELTLIDPASGSGHILVEAYELFKAIYLERGYRQRDVPELILEKNLFGLDIDERAAQLTGFALMMKGRADDRRLFEWGVKLNVMALVDSAGFDAEGLAKGVALANYGLKSGDLTELKRLFEHATTFGSLIQVPEGLAAKLPALKQLSEATSQDLFVSEALKRLGPLVHQAELLAAQYDAVVANPPYIGSKFHIPILKKFLKDHYKGYEKDVFSAFIDRDLAFSKPLGHLGFMSPFVWMFISSHEHLRTRLIDEETITSLVQLEYSGFEGATVPICTFTLQKTHVDGRESCFIRLSEFRGSSNQGPKTLEAVRNRECGWFFEAAPDEFKKVPGSPIAYWVSSALRRLFTEYSSIGEHCEAQKGLVTCDSDRFVRCWWEAPIPGVGFGISDCEAAVISECRWFPYNKGGAFRRWSGNVQHLVNWEADGAEVKAHIAQRYPYLKGNTSFVTQDTDNYFRRAIVWTTISSADRSFRLSPGGEIASNASQCAFPSEGDLLTLLAFLNTPIVTAVMRAMSPTLNSNLTEFLAMPFPEVNGDGEVEASTASLVRLAQNDWDSFLQSWDFQFLPLLTASSEPTPTLESSYTAWITQNRDTIAEMKRLEEANNRLFIDAYGLAEELTPDVPIDQITLTVNPAYRYGGKLTEEEQWTRFRQDTMEELVSYAIGCMMGRYSLDAPGLIYAHSGNAGFDPSQYTTFPADDDGIIPLTDNEWFDDDACNRLIEFLSKAWPAEHLEANLTFLAENLSPKRNESSRETLRRYLNDTFFKNHLQGYKKRPIYWLFSSGKEKAFQCLVYLHRYNEGTLARMRTEYAIPLQGKLSAQIDRLEDDVAAASSTSQRNKLEKQRTTLKKQLEELRQFDEKLRHYADKRISIDLDDGVKVNYGKFGDLLANVRDVTGKKPEVL